MLETDLTAREPSAWPNRQWLLSSWPLVWLEFRVPSSGSCAHEICSTLVGKVKGAKFIPDLVSEAGGLMMTLSTSRVVWKWKP